MTTFADLIRSMEWQGAARLTDTSAFPPAAPANRLSLERGFDDYYQAGIESFKAGDKLAAHALWRDAATTDPYQEKVWVALLRVLDDDDDRRVCLDNILAINPGNGTARRALDELLREQARAAKRRQLPLPIRFVLALLRGIWIGVLASAIAMGVSILLYGFTPAP